MKRTSAAFGFLVLFSATASAGVYTVAATGGADYTNIQAAVDAAIATGGTNTVRIVDSSSYDEQVTFTGADAGDNITIEALSGQSPMAYAVLHSELNALQLRNLTFDGSVGAGVDNGIDVNGATGDISIEDCTVQDSSGWAFYALRAREVAGTTITVENVMFRSLTNCAVARHGTSAGDLVLVGCSFSNSLSAIYDLRNSNIGSFIIRSNLFHSITNYSYYHEDAGTPPDSSTLIGNNTFYNCGDEDWEGIRVRNVNDFGLHLEDNLFYGRIGVNMYGQTPTAIDADYNGFCNMVSVGYWDGGFRTLAELNAFSDSTNNVENDADPFINAPGGDFRLAEGSWAATASSGGGFIGAFPVPPPAGTVFVVR